MSVTDEYPDRNAGAVGTTDGVHRFDFDVVTGRLNEVG